MLPVKNVYDAAEQEAHIKSVLAALHKHSGGSVLGSIIAGLVVGGILFAIGFGPYKRWKATHPKAGPPPRF